MGRNPQAAHTLLLEGLRVSNESEKETDSYVAGTITADQLVERTLARFGLT
ncbi:antitoxin VbhA family protein [Corynebacterium lubricantis]|uniref:antitoxin VbhA family protein n=1 Tax=Corynebacterium lubricantis TaxID=541095 RepID=UPI00146142F3|nr:antitoxin VbhA family protein [Corynebacterium lubricantis]